MIEPTLTLGIELGSTRIKAVMIDEHRQVLATGSFQWENQLKEGIWTYELDQVWEGIQASYAELKEDYSAKYQKTLHKIDYMGISAMMHGYLAFDTNGNLLAPFRTWRNAITEEAEKELTELFQFNIPQRWSIAHLYQAILNEELHLKDIAYFTTLAGYVHWRLTGEKVLGIGDASGMFPIDSMTQNYHEGMLETFGKHIEGRGYSWELNTILPKVRVAGFCSGKLTQKGASLLDPSGELLAGTILCPPEGDAGTGMVATNSVAKRTGNISAGTSIFAMIVLEKALSKVYPEVDLVTTPSGDAVAMVHANNCTSDLNAWIGIFQEFLAVAGIDMPTGELYRTLLTQALKGDMDAGGLLTYGYLSGENITKMPEGRPLFVRMPESQFNLANFMRSHLYSAFGALCVGMNSLTEIENVQIDKIFGHGGIFKTKGVAQQILASAINAPVSVMETAGEGGAWGIAILADYLKHANDDMTLSKYLDEVVFTQTESVKVEPDPLEVSGFESFTKRYLEGLAIQKTAIDYLKLEESA
ncbi:MAG: FGGY-family carbohydrate kinase [Turicibacter sp.]|nr:FGGY-family carbohydrate kinase [Turicibacter sp.]